MDSAITARGLQKTYKGGTRALKGVDLEIGRGAFLALLGPNGAGKSSLIRILATLARPDDGEASVLGMDAATRARDIRRRTGTALQDLNLDPEETVARHLVFQARLFGKTKARAEETAERLLRDFALEPNRDKKAGTLSGGNKRRLHIALALVNDPELIVLDEPTTGMDPEIRSAFWNELGKRNRDDGLTILFSTQYLDEAERHAKELAVIKAGRIAWRGETNEFAPGGAGSLEERYLAFISEKEEAEEKNV